MSRRLLTLLAVLALAVGVLTPVAAGAADVDASDLEVPASAVEDIKSAKVQTYIVQMLEDPAIAYEGDIAGYAATKPKPGKKINPNSAAVKKYTKRLADSHHAALASVGGPEMIYSYVYAFNGFAARLTGAQASALASSPHVLAVSVDEMRKPDTVSTPSFLGLNEAGGIWDQLGGFESAGEDVIVGIIDTGIWIENPSFSDRVDLSFQPGNSAGKPGKGKKDLAYGPPPADWNGDCEEGEAFGANYCNNKVIGARYFHNGYAVQELQLLGDYLSPRDGDGHGSHTASTAAGNYGVPVEVDGEDLGMASGMAPRARIAAYKVCWGGDDGGCFNSDSVAAINQAVADGVDVLNFSISGSRTSFLDPVEVAFLYAADAGVFVAASAGNAGATSTVAHNSPWLTTVAAGTHDRYFEGTLTLGNGNTYTGAMMAEGPISGDLVYAGDAGDALCNLGSLDPAVVSGKIVFCDRGDIARVDKSLEVKRAGGIGMIHANTSPNSVNADLHYVPTIHIDDVDGAVVRSYADAGGGTATIKGSVSVVAEAPQVAAFSSRGPALASGDLLKPDIMAPGVDIIAAVAPPFAEGRNFDSYSGTSMSSPHIAGIGALMKDVHPDWSPMMIKSALMTTAAQETNQSNPIPGDPFGYGAGHVAPNAATDPGLVYDAGWADWLGFIFEWSDRSNLNYPSIAIGELAVTQTVTRTVTNVGTAGTYNVSVNEPNGVTITVDPTSLTLGEGESATYSVTFDVTESASLGSYEFGDLTWSDGTHQVRSPLAVRPVQIVAPDEIHEAGDASGSLSFPVTFGYSGNFSARVQGLVPATMETGMVVDDPANDINTALASGVGVTFHFVDVPANQLLARFSLFDEYTDGYVPDPDDPEVDDLDLYAFKPNGKYFGGSGSGTSEEEINVENPVAGTWIIAVHGWQTNGPDSNYTLFSWSFGDADAGNTTLTAPTSAALGATGTVTLNWTDLDTGTRYLGAIVYDEGATGTDFDSTIVRIDTD